jgi:hypothetical protein
LLGAAGAIGFGGVATLVVVVVWWWGFPALRDVDRFADVIADRPAAPAAPAPPAVTRAPRGTRRQR